MINDPNAVVLPQFHSYPTRRYLLEVGADAGQDSVLFVHGLGFLTGGQPDGWTVERFQALLPYRTQFGAKPKDVRDRHVVVTSAGAFNLKDDFAVHLPLLTSELYTETFNRVLEEFAHNNRLRIVVKVYTTYGTMYPEDSMGPDDDLSFTDRDRRFGPEDGDVVIMHFFTAELLKLDAKECWARVLEVLQLSWGTYFSPFQRHDASQPRRFDGRDTEAFLLQFAQIPETILGNPDRVTVRNFACARVTLLRHHFKQIEPEGVEDAEATDDSQTEETKLEPQYEEIVTARTFLLESADEQRRRHLGNASDRPA